MTGNPRLRAPHVLHPDCLAATSSERWTISKPCQGGSAGRCADDCSRVTGAQPPAPYVAPGRTWPPGGSGAGRGDLLGPPALVMDPDRLLGIAGFALMIALAFLVDLVRASTIVAVVAALVGGVAFGWLWSPVGARSRPTGSVRGSCSWCSRFRWGFTSGISQSVNGGTGPPVPRSVHPRGNRGPGAEREAVPTFGRMGFMDTKMSWPVALRWRRNRW